MSTLVSDLKENPELERAVELLIDGNGINSPLIKCSTFHVALETIVGLINSENKKFFEPIKNTKNLKLLKEELQTIVSSKKEKFSQTEFDSLIKKITYINTPFNKDKFLLAYDFYKIDNCMLDKTLEQKGVDHRHIVTTCLGMIFKQTSYLFNKNCGYVPIMEEKIIFKDKEDFKYKEVKAARGIIIPLKSEFGMLYAHAIYSIKEEQLKTA